MVGKQRMTSLDVRATVAEMRSCLIGLRLLNLYDLSPVMFLFKFGHGEQKRSVLLESGVRMHLTDLVREKPRIPSQFTLKLRKHVRSWRLDSITQLQHDRTIDMCFGVASSTGCFHILVELFAKGNLILTDHAYNIMMLLRTHKDKDVSLLVHSVYPVTTPLSLVEGGDAEGAAGNTTSTSVNNNGNEDNNDRDDNDSDVVRSERAAVLWREWCDVFARQSEYETTRATLSAVQHFGNSLADHILAVTHTSNVRKKDLRVSSQELFAQLLPGMLDAWRLARAPLPPGAYLIQDTPAAGDKKGNKQPQQRVDADATSDNNNSSSDNNSSSAAAVTTTTVSAAVHYDDFSPVLLAQYTQPGVRVSHRDSFGKACEEYFLPTETERIEQHNTTQQKTVLSKREKFERDHARRITALEREQELNERRGACIAANAARIDEAIGLVNGALAAGLQWDALRSLLKRRHAEGHPVAYMIHDLHLERNAISVLLESELYDDEDDKDVPAMVVEVDLGLTAHANASVYYGKRKANQVKLSKTLAATAKAAAGAARAGNVAAAKQKARKPIVLQRSRGWWEKLRWFRTSAGDVVLQGRDAQTTELLLRRVALAGDVWIFCDIDGALPCLLRPMRRVWTGAVQGSTNTDDKDGDDERDGHGEDTSRAASAPVSRVSVHEAGAWCVSNSGAWENKQTVGAWWVYASQVTSINGSFFDFAGERRHILPQALALGCGLLFRVARDVRVAAMTTVATASDDADAAQAISEVAHTASCDGGGDDDDKDDVAADTATTLQLAPAKEATRPQQARHGNATATTTRAGAAPVVAAAAAAPATPTTTSQLTRHQRRKLKKIASKYKDQDDEDRLYGAQLNGNQLAKVQLQQHQQHAQHVDAAVHSEDEDEHKDTASASEQGDDDTRASHADAAAVTTPAPTRRTATAAATTLTAEASDAELRAALPYYTCRPRSDDTVLHVVAVCAPFRTLVDYTYRVELAAGNVKRGQAAQAILAHFRQLASAPLTTRSATQQQQRQRHSNKSKGSGADKEDDDTAKSTSDNNHSSSSSAVSLALQNMTSDELVEQLRGNAKPLKIRIQ